MKESRHRRARPSAKGLYHTTLVRPLLFAAVLLEAAKRKSEHRTMKGAMGPSDGSRQLQDGTGGGGGSEIDAAEQMRRAIAAVAAGAGSSDEVQAAARTFVNELRQHKEPPEKMLLKIKELLGSAGLRAGFPTDALAPADRETAVYRDVIVWSIRAYYEGTDGDGKR